MDNIIFRPSTAHRWVNCPGSVIYDSAPQEDNEYMIEGKIAHALAELAISARKLPSELPVETVQIKQTGPDGIEKTVSREVPLGMPETVDIYVNALFDSANGQPVFAETKVDIPACPQNGGTIDAYIVKDDRIEIHDLKFGRKPVKAEGNEQLILYASGLLSTIRDVSRDIESSFPVVLVIHQPNLGLVDEWETTAGDILERADDIYQLTLKILAGYREKIPGEKQCAYCKGRSFCTALEQRVREDIADDVQDISKPLSPYVASGAIERVQSYDLSMLGSTLSVLPLVELWIDAVRNRAKEELLAGHEIKGWKLVAGRQSARKWIDEKAAERRMARLKLKKNERFEIKLLSPSKLEKLIGKEKFSAFSGLYSQEPGEPVVAPENDKRPKLEISPASEDFNNLLTHKGEL